MAPRQLSRPFAFRLSLKVGLLQSLHNLFFTISLFSELGLFMFHNVIFLAEKVHACHIKTDSFYQNYQGNLLKDSVI